MNEKYGFGRFLNCELRCSVQRGNFPLVLSLTLEQNDERVFPPKYARTTCVHTSANLRVWIQVRKIL